MQFDSTTIDTVIPTKIVDGICMNYEGQCEEIRVPLATFESPIWHSLKRGALMSQKSGGINVVVVDDCMTRSIILEAENLHDGLLCSKWIDRNFNMLAATVEQSSRFAKLKDIFVENIGRLIYIRFSLNTQNAAGHNMVTKSADALAACIVQNFSDEKKTALRYISVSGNICVDKKVSAINGILGRGKKVIAEVYVPRDTCTSVLKTSPEKIAELNTKKNLLGSILAGSVRSANAHFANVILAIYLATGQDGANVVEASQGITFAETNESGDLHFSVTVPNLVVGVIGNGKNLPFVRQNLEMMGCYPENENSAKRLAAIIGVSVLCAELSLLAALTNPGELMSAHLKLERDKK